ncbi:MAG TPA: ABC transporter permease [Jiangellaceae bacterium]
MTTTREPDSARAAPPTRALGPRVVDVIFRRREASILLVTLALFVYFSSVNSAFFSEANMRVLSHFTYPIAMIALGQVMLLVCGQLDLSAGHVFAFTPFVLLFFIEAGVPTAIGVVLAVAAASGVGLLNGLITVKIGVHPFITTLGMAFVLQGSTLIIADGRPTTPPDLGSVESEIFGRFPFVGIMWAVVLTALMYVVLTNTRWGIYTFATGGNPLGAREAGVPIDRIKIGNFMMCSALAGFAGTLEGYRISSFDPLSGGFTTMFFAISAAVIGGTALAGGSGTIIGGFLGALFIGVLRDGFTIEGISSFQLFIYLGVAIIISMVLNVWLSRLRRGAMLS